MAQIEIGEFNRSVINSIWGPVRILQFHGMCPLNGKQEYIPVGWVLPARYRTGGLCPVGLPNWDPPGQRPPSWTETPLLDRDPPPGQRPPSWTETLPRQRPPGQRPPQVMWPVVHAGTETPPVNRMTHACENITLPQTSFAGGKNVV